MKTTLKPIFIHFFAIVAFVIAALAYFSPVIQSKKLPQSDITQYIGMAKEQTDFKKATAEEPYWTNSAFGGMPTFQLGANYPHNYIKKLDKLIRFLPRPADYLFLYLLSFYILLSCLKVDPRLAVLGALAFGFSTYLIIILGVGHNAKAHALGYLPMLLGGIVLVFRKKYFVGFILTAFAMALEITANHYQMTYYFMLLVLVFGIVKLIETIQKKTYKHFGKAVGILVLAVILGIATNATGIMATKQYADWSTRGKTDITVDINGVEKAPSTGLDSEYITQWSYGITESLNLFVPRLFGGGSQENLGEDSKTYDFLREQGLSRAKSLDFTSGMPMYWGDQPGTSGPAYIGAIILFLFILGLFVVKKNIKWWLLGGTILSLFLSWGKNFSILTDFMIDYFPLYNKFRAVSSIQIILEICVPVLAILALSELIIKKKLNKTQKNRALKFTTIIVFGIGAVLFLLKGNFSFEGLSDSRLLKYYGPEIMAMIQLDRKAIYVDDLLRSLLFVVLTAISLWLFIHKKIKTNLTILIIGFLIVIDLVGVGVRYVSKDQFVSKRKVDTPFSMTPWDIEIKKDKSIFRVYDPSEGLMGARTSYYHQSIGGYHGAKPRGMQELFDFHIYKNHVNVLNMLNVKYIIQSDEAGSKYAAVNPEACGNAWFVNKIIPVSSANEALLGLQSLDVKNEVVLDISKFSEIKNNDLEVDSLATITLEKYQPNHLQYQSNNIHKNIAVFSEMYYANGWNAFIDGKKTTYFKVNHVLRALEVPAGKHLIEFRFEPQVVKKGSRIVLASNIVLFILIIGGFVYKFVANRKEKLKEKA